MYSQDEILKYIRGIPKIELHLHIEGSFEPDLVFEIAKRNGLTVKIEGNSNQETLIFDTPAQLAKAYSFDNLQEFLDIYYAGMNVLQSEQDFYDLTMAYLIKCNDQNIVHTEIFFDPQGHTSRGIPFATVINGIYSALQEGEKKFGISSGLILSYLRHLSEEDAINTWQEAQPHLDKFIAVGLDSSELGHPPSKFKHVFSMARDANKKLVAHAGEEGPPEYIWQALDILKVDRIDHGNRSLEDPKLIERLVKEKIALTVCPLSNDKLQVVKNIKDHPLKRMLDLGLVATVHSDDPAYFGGYMNENFSAIQTALSLSIDDINTLVHHSIEGSFMSENRKIKLHTDINNYHKIFIQSQA